MSWRPRGAYAFLLPFAVLAAIDPSWRAWRRYDLHFPAGADARNMGYDRASNRAASPRPHHRIVIDIEAPDEHRARVAPATGGRACRLDSGEAGGEAGAVAGNS